LADGCSILRWSSAGRRVRPNRPRQTRR
jgi:hypothetical protein